MPKTVYTETRLYPVTIHREDNLWGYSSPEFGGGGAASLEEALWLAQNLLKTSVADFHSRGKDVPQPLSPDQVDSGDWQVIWLPVTVSSAPEQVLLTLPRSLVTQIDAVTDDRSAFFAKLAREQFAQ